MDLPRLLVLTCVLGVSAALFYARGAPARELPALSPSAVTAALPPAPSLTQLTAQTSTTPAADVPAPKHKPKKKRHPRR